MIRIKLLMQSYKAFYAIALCIALCTNVSSHALVVAAGTLLHAIQKTMDAHMGFPGTNNF